MKNLLAAGIGVIALVNVFSDSDRFVMALKQWEQRKTPATLLHLATSGFFLARDLGALG